MTIVNKTQLLVTLINVHICKPEDQQELTDLLGKGVNEIHKNVSGFISANIHKSLDGVRVTNYAQYRSRKDVEAA
jgi:Antibiotic biosynthesis monooxygenase